ncbi:MAG: hypothetical protein KDE33_22120 [Bacteroidetes bacterium]|nr:hypothetical protein [Bacteroidota bacterium]MCB9226364.1 hypothetical protein [Chitinophagales bacterium]
MACATGCSTSSDGCNKMNTFDWFKDIPLSNNYNFNIIEVSFKDGARKAFYRNKNHIDLYKNDYVVVESSQGYDIGKLSLSGELVKLQMKKKNVKNHPDNIRDIVRKATEDDINKLENYRNKEKQMLVKARVIARNLNLDMKIGDIEYQGDGKKATFYYTSDNRVDFRELVKQYASEFKIKIEMRQIGARQESARIGGMGPCGRELCCSSWLSDFDSVSTSAARYQQLSINPDKLSGQCGRLKCCLNYELDTYMDALKSIPKNCDKLKTQEGMAYLRKTDIFKLEMTYFVEETNKYFKLSTKDVLQIKAMLKDKKTPLSLAEFSIIEQTEEKELEDAYATDLVGSVSLNTLEQKGKNKRRNKNKNKNRRNPKNRRNDK